VTQISQDKDYSIQSMTSHQCQECSGWKKKTAYVPKEEHNVMFIVAGFNTGANDVLNASIDS